MSDDHYNEYSIFRGLQRPLEFMGIQGRYIYWAAATAAGAILGFILGYCLFGFLVGLVLLVVSLCTGGALIIIKQQRGLHSKKEEKGVFILSRTTKM